MIPSPARMSYGAKVISAGVLFKAVIMGTLVSVLAVASFTESLVLVLVSACATGIFGLLIVLVQTRAESRLHERIDKLEVSQSSKIDEQTEKIDARAETIVQAIETAGNGETSK